jgi:hypothetical protein
LYLVNYLGTSQHGDIVTTLISFALCYIELHFGITTQISVKLKIQCVPCKLLRCMIMVKIKIKDANIVPGKLVGQRKFL